MLSTCANVSARKAPGFWAAQCRRTTASPEVQPMCHRLSLPRPSEVPRKSFYGWRAGTQVLASATAPPRLRPRTRLTTPGHPGSSAHPRHVAAARERGAQARQVVLRPQRGAAARARVGARRGCGVAQRECRRVHARQRAQRLPSDRVRESASGRTRRLRIQCSAKHTPPAPRSGLRVHFGSYKTHGRRQFHAR